MNDQQLLSLALRSGASLAGIANADILRMSPSHQATCQQTLPEATRTVLVIARHHPGALPELDYWGGKGGTRGNLSLIRMAKDIARQAESDLDICAVPLEYPPTDRGTFLKDAAVLAGMGVLGKNNLLVTPEYGPRVRLGALAIEIELPPTERRAGFDPCSSCATSCQEICPQAAFPGSRYDRAMCKTQMRIDESAPLSSDGAHGYCVPYCRKCELVCPSGEIEAAGTAEIG
jgi:epoxyqueuosine reductase